MNWFDVAPHDIAKAQYEWDRRLQMRRMHDLGFSFAEIGRRCDLGRTRVAIIVRQTETYKLGPIAAWADAARAIIPVVDMLRRGPLPPPLSQRSAGPRRDMRSDDVAAEITHQWASGKTQIQIGREFGYDNSSAVCSRISTFIHRWGTSNYYMAYSNEARKEAGLDAVKRFHKAKQAGVTL
jgi:hypothetical protein